jgi:hypothetical protein
MNTGNSLGDPNPLKEQKMKDEKRIKPQRENEFSSTQTKELWLSMHSKSVELLCALPIY